MTNRAWNAFGSKTKVRNPDGNIRWGRVHMNERMLKLIGGEYESVHLIEDENGDYLGWLDRDADTGELLDEVKMVNYHTYFDISFPYGSAKKEKDGQGVVVRLRIEAAGN